MLDGKDIGCDSRGVIIRKGCVKGLMVCLPQGVGEIIGRHYDYHLTPIMIRIEQYVMFR